VHPLTQRQGAHILEFKNDIEILNSNLRVLAQVIEEVQHSLPLHPLPQSPDVSTGLSHVLGHFQQTVEECYAFLEAKASHGTRDGALNNLAYHFRGGDEELNMHRDRVVFLNIKVRPQCQAPGCG
jgi:hypothetical protein